MVQCQKCARTGSFSCVSSLPLRAARFRPHPETGARGSEPDLQFPIRWCTTLVYLELNNLTPKPIESQDKVLEWAHQIPSMHVGSDDVYALSGRRGKGYFSRAAKGSFKEQSLPLEFADVSLARKIRCIESLYSCGRLNGLAPNPSSVIPEG
jgi:hypothetical protein